MQDQVYWKSFIFSSLKFLVWLFATWSDIALFISFAPTDGVKRRIWNALDTSCWSLAIISSNILCDLIVDYIFRVSPWFIFQWNITSLKFHEPTNQCRATFTFTESSSNVKFMFPETFVAWFPSLNLYNNVMQIFRLFMTFDNDFVIFLSYIPFRLIYIRINFFFPINDSIKFDVWYWLSR